MKKRLLITSIVMMLVVAVALGTSTYAWFTSNTSVTTSAVSLRAAVSGSSSLGIGWLGGEAGTSITTNAYGVLNPMAPATLTPNTTTSDVFFKSATIKQEDSVEKFNGDAAISYAAIEATVGTTSVTGKYEVIDGRYVVTEDSVAQDGKTYYTKNFAPVFFQDDAGVQAFYVRNLSHTNDIGTITVSAVFADSDVYVLTKDTNFVEGVKYYTTDGSAWTLASVTAGEAVGANTYYEKVDADDMIRVAIFTKAAHAYSGAASGEYKLLGVLGKTATAETAVTGSYDKNATYYTKDGTVYTQARINSFADATDYYTLANTAAYYTDGESRIDLNDNVKDLGHFTTVSTSLTLASSLAHDQQIDIVAIVWLDGTELTDARAGELGQVSLTFAAA